MRPLGIPTLEDKVAQRAIVMLLEPIYEADFLPCSYGFRPGRSAHDALDTLYESVGKQGQGWVIDVDLAGYFESIPHAEIRALLDLRIKDGVVRRMLNKWLGAGVLEAGILYKTDTGTPQGGVVSPLIANLVLHYVLDQWFVETVQPRLRGRSQLVRYADDFVMTFADAEDGQRVLAVLGKRLGRYGLTLNATKTHYVDFRRPQGADGQAPQATFDFLGFTHLWGRSRKGYWVVRQVTAKKRFARGLKAVSEWCKRHRHAPLEDQRERLASVIRGHCKYYGVTGNGKRFGQFRYEVVRIWQKWLSRRSRKSRVHWERMGEVLQRYPLPPATIMRRIHAA